MKPAVNLLAAIAAVAGAFYAFAPHREDGMVYVPEGSAILGFVYYTGLYGPMPYEVDGFWIDKFEVTNAEYADFVEDTGHTAAAFYDDIEFNIADQAVSGVQHADAMDYCEWAGKRLPSELEWEKAARGENGQIYPWGNVMNMNFAHLTGNAPISVTSFPSDISPYGVRGMAGNVSEWVSDTRDARAGKCYDNNVVTRDATPEMRILLASLAAANNGVLPEICLPPEPSDQSIPSEPCAYIKGNSWNGREHMTVASNRMWDYTNTYAEFVGFRCAKGE